jgi:hypothetical protein
MINNINTGIQDQGIRLSKEVREFCEEAKARGEGKNDEYDKPQFKTMAEAWVYLVLIGAKYPNENVSDWKAHKDPIKWRFIPGDWQKILLLKAFTDMTESSIDYENLSTIGLRYLENLAVIGVKHEDEHRRKI